MLFQVGFGIRGLTRKEIRKLQLKHEMCVNSRNLLNHDVANNGSSTGLHMSRSFSGPIALQQLQSSIVTSESVIIYSYFFLVLDIMFNSVLIKFNSL